MEFREALGDGFRKSVPYLFSEILLLNWCCAVLVASRSELLLSQKVGGGVSLLLGGFVFFTVFLLRNLRSRGDRISVLEDFFILVPGLLIGYFLVLPGFRFGLVFPYFFFYAFCFHPYLPRKFSWNSVREKFGEIHRGVRVDLEISAGFFSYLLRTLFSLLSREPETRNEKFGITDEDPQELGEEEDFGNLRDFRDENTVMQLIRKKTPEGADHLEAFLRADFQANEKTIPVHLGFCPVFLQSPELEVHQLEGEEVDVKIVQLSPLGLRLDLKRPSSRTRAETVRLCVFATEGFSPDAE